MRLSFGRIIIAIVLVVGLIAAVALVRRQQQSRGEAAEAPTAIPTFSFQLTPSPTPPGLIGDFDGSGKIDSLDYNIFLKKFEEKDKDADLDGSGEVNSLDLNLFLSNWDKQK